MTIANPSGRIPLAQLSFCALNSRQPVDVLEPVLVLKHTFLELSEPIIAPPALVQGP